MSSPFCLKEAARAAHGHLQSVRPDTPIGPLKVDSRSIEKGDWFVALPGERRDGHDFVPEAVRRGAAGVVLSREIAGLPSKVPCLRVENTLRALQEIAAVYRRTCKAQVIGITGSNGKTTTKDMIARVLEGVAGSILATKGNLNSQVGLPLMLMELRPTHTHAVLEMGASRQGEIARLARLAAPRAAVLTNIGAAHLETFGTLEDVAEAKWELAAAIPPDGMVVLNADDVFLTTRRKRLKCPVITYGLNRQADVHAENVSLQPSVTFSLAVEKRRETVRLSVFGSFNVYNALAAAAVGIQAGVALPEIASRLGSFRSSRLRMEVRKTRHGALFVLDAYNANPSSMKASLESFVKTYPDLDKIAVTGSMRELGKESQTHHVELGRCLAGLPLKRVFFVGEEGEWVLNGYKKAGGQVPFSTGTDKSSVRTGLEPFLSGNTAVLFKASRGAALEDIFGPLLKDDRG